MSALAVARNDLRVWLHSRGGLLVAGFFVLWFGGLAYALARLADPTVQEFVDVLAALVVLLLPVVGVVLGYGTVVTERSTGRIALVMALPTSRAELVVGKLIGRTTVLAGGLLAGGAAGAVVLAAAYPAFEPGRYGLFVVATLLYGLPFVAIATALSMTSATPRRAIAGAFGAYVALVMFWNELVDVAVVILFRFDPTALADVPAWAESAKFASPRTAFVALLAQWLDVGTGPPSLDLTTQWFASPGAAVAVLLGWVVLPPLVAYARFARAEF